MIEAEGNLWYYPADIRVITTNGEVNSMGELIMGKGVAKQAKERFPGIALELGMAVLKNGNNPISYTAPDHTRIWTFPTKHHYAQDADLDLIQHSAKRLVRLADLLQEVRTAQNRSTDLVVVMPRPGVGNGHLPWALVKERLEHLLDDRFVVLIPPNGL